MAGRDCKPSRVAVVPRRSALCLDARLATGAPGREHCAEAEARLRQHSGLHQPHQFKGSRARATSCSGGVELAVFPCTWIAATATSCSSSGQTPTCAVAVSLSHRYRFSHCVLVTCHGTSSRTHRHRLHAARPSLM